jgi:hypothetical protein
MVLLEAGEEHVMGGSEAINLHTALKSPRSAGSGASSEMRSTSGNSLSDEVGESVGVRSIGCCALDFRDGIG